jgi:hypothetical protein
MEAAGFFETVETIYRTTDCHFAEARNLKKKNEAVSYGLQFSCFPISGRPTFLVSLGVYQSLKMHSEEAIHKLI